MKLPLKIALLAVFFISCSQIAGKGDAEKAAKEWADRSYPGMTASVDCAGRDTGDDGYVSCTVVLQGENAPRDPVPLECGVNRWYHGCNTYGCKLPTGFVNQRR